MTPRVYRRQVRYQPPACTSCPATRQLLAQRGRISPEMAANATRVIAKSGILRYLECQVCGRRWKEAED